MVSYKDTVAIKCPQGGWYAIKERKQTQSFYMSFDSPADSQ